MPVRYHPFIILFLIVLICLTSGCAAASPAPQTSVTPAPTIGEISPTAPRAVQVFPTLTSPTPQVENPTATSLATGTPPRSGQVESTADTSSFPVTILYVGYGGGGPGLNCEQEMEKSPRGLMAGTFDGWPQLLHLMAICIWGMPLEKTLGIALASPDGSQVFSAAFTTFVDTAPFYKVEWDGMPPYEYDANDAMMRQDGKSEMNLLLWWPDGLPGGDWQIVVTAGNVRVDGILSMVDPPHPWVSLQPFDDRLHSTNNACEVLPAERRNQPLRVAGGGFTPGKEVQFALYYQENSHADYRRLVTYSTEANNAGRIELTLQGEASDPAGIYRLIALTPITQPFFQTANVNALVEAYDCFYLP